MSVGDGAAKSPSPQSFKSLRSLGANLLSFIMCSHTTLLSQSRTLCDVAHYIKPSPLTVAIAALESGAPVGLLNVEHVAG